MWFGVEHEVIWLAKAVKKCDGPGRVSWLCRQTSSSKADVSRLFSVDWSKFWLALLELSSKLSGKSSSLSFEESAKKNSKFLMI